MIIRTVYLIASLAVSALGQNAVESLQTQTVRDIPADVKAYYDIHKNRVVPPGEAEADPDAWDLSFSNTSIAVNGSVQFVDEAFDDLKEAPEDGYTFDAGPEGTPLPGGSGTGWYHYNMDFHVVTPVANRTIVLRTKDGLYAKVAIISYYEGAVEGLGDPRFYTFRYALQTDGSRNLESATCDEEELECRVDG